MPSLIDHLAKYAEYHRDPRNLACHFIGIPMIVLAVAVLLARPAVEGPFGWTLSPIWAVATACSLFYLRLDLRFGLIMAGILLAVTVAAQMLAALPTSIWLSAGLGLFIIGWIIQFIGHWYEGRRPAFVDDILGLLIGPLFVVAEAAFALGLYRSLREAIESRRQVVCDPQK